MSLQTILVVDEDAGVRETLHGWLERAGRRILEAATAERAAECAAEAEFIVAGQTQEGAGPFELLRRLRRARPEGKVALMGEPGPGAVLRAMRAQAFSYFHKPVPRAPLLDMAQAAGEPGSWRDDIKLISAVPRWIEMQVRCKLAAVERAAHFVREIEAALPQPTCEDVTGAFRELLLNGVEHGCGSDARKSVRVCLMHAGRVVIVCVQDPGKGFSMDLLPHAAISNPDDAPTRHLELRDAQGRRAGGFGMLMARCMVDELVYNERGNAVMFVKYLK